MLGPKRKKKGLGQREKEKTWVRNNTLQCNTNNRYISLFPPSRRVQKNKSINIHVLCDFLVTVKAAPHELVIRTVLP